MSEEKYITLDLTEGSVRMELPQTKSLIDKFIAMFGCDTARISSYNSSSDLPTHFLILGWNKNTKTEREAGREHGQWLKDGEPIDFDYVHEQVVASGNTEDELIASAEHYKSLIGMTWDDYFKVILEEPPTDLNDQKLFTVAHAYNITLPKEDPEDPRADFLLKKYWKNRQ
jgi:hypothetical protein